MPLLNLLDKVRNHKVHDGVVGGRQAVQEGAHLRQRPRVGVQPGEAGNLLHTVGGEEGRQPLHEEVF